MLQATFQTCDNFVYTFNSHIFVFKNLDSVICAIIVTAQNVSSLEFVQQASFACRYLTDSIVDFVRSFTSCEEYLFLANNNYSRFLIKFEDL